MAESLPGNMQMVSLEVVQAAVDELYAFRDHYFENHSIDEAHQKPSDVQKQLEKTMAIIDSVTDSPRMKAEYLMLRGRALNVLPQYSKEAEDCLSKAVKLDPKLSEAWSYLGECYWKNNQVELARNCFVGSLSHSKHKLALRNLSMVMRQLGIDDAERRQNIEESVALAKNAVQLDITDGTSWFILGNAYFTMFFNCGQSSTVLRQCLSAYQQAEKDPVANCNCDLHYNRANLYQFQEEYDLALIGYARALALDPTFTLAKEKHGVLVQYLSDVSHMVQTRGKLRGKKLQSLVDKISLQSDLGPFSGGSYASASGLRVTLTPVTVSGLQAGVNSERVIVGRVVCSVSTESAITFTFCMVDSEGICCSVTVYNIVQGWGVKIGDSVAIAEPFLQRVDVQHQDQRMKFENIRVASPVMLVVNGRKLSQACQAASQLKLCTFSE